jgi:hypothetical protein
MLPETRMCESGGTVNEPFSGPYALNSAENLFKPVLAFSKKL